MGIAGYVDSRRTARLLIDAVERYSPCYAEGGVIRLFRDALRDARIPYRLQRVRSARRVGPRANIVATLGPQPPAVVLVGHVDTVAIEDGSRRCAVVSGDRLTGLGAADSKGGCAAMVEALRAVVDSGAALERGVCLGLVVGEEEYGDGAARLAAEITAPLTIVAEPTLLRPCTAHSGYLEAHLVAVGRRAHAAFPASGCNAIGLMTTWLAALAEALGGDTAVNVREIHGGDGGFVVADRCEAFVDMHLPPGVGPEGVEERIERCRQAAMEGVSHGTLAYRRPLWSPGFREDEGRSELGMLRDAFGSAGVPWSPTVFPSHSDAPRFHRGGAVTVVCGPGDLLSAHRPGEWVSLEQTARAARLFAAIIERVCGASGSSPHFPC